MFCVGNGLGLAEKWTSASPCLAAAAPHRGVAASPLILAVMLRLPGSGALGFAVRVSVLGFSRVRRIARCHVISLSTTFSFITEPRGVSRGRAGRVGRCHVIFLSIRSIELQVKEEGGGRRVEGRGLQVEGRGSRVEGGVRMEE